MEKLGQLRRAGEIEFDLDPCAKPPALRMRVPVATTDGRDGQLLLGPGDMLELLHAIQSAQMHCPEAFPGTGRG